MFTNVCVYIQTYVCEHYNITRTLYPHQNVSSELDVDKIWDKKLPLCVCVCVCGQFNKLGMYKIWEAKSFVTPRYHGTILEYPSFETSR